MALCLDLKSYIEHYIKNNKSYANSQLEVEKSKANYQINSDLYKSQFTVTPTIGNSRIEVPGLITDDKSGQVNYQLKQNLASGTEIKLEAFELFDKPDSSIKISESKLSLNLSQQLWKNAFGKSDRLKRNASKLEVQQRSLSLLQSKLNTCTDATINYLAALSLQEKLNIQKELSEMANRALNTSEKAYRKRIIRKIDILAARSDAINMQAQHKEAELRYQNEKNKLYTLAEIPISDEALSPLPDSLKSWLPMVNTQPDSSPGIEALKVGIKSKQYLINSSRELNKNDLRLGLIASRTEGIDATSSGFVNYKDDFWGVSLSFEWPIINDTLEANVAHATYQKEIAQNNLEEQTKLWNVNLNKSLKEAGVYKELLELSSKKTKLYTGQIQEAERLLKAGKIEFETYISYRDIYLKEQLQQVDLKRQLITQKLNIANLTNNSDLVCMGNP